MSETDNNDAENVDISQRDIGLTRMLQAVEFIPGSNIIIKKTAKQCCANDAIRITDQVIDRILNEDFELSEDREKEITVTVKELLLNSGIALGEEEECDVYIEYYFGKKGILIRIKDEGPGYDYKEEAEKKERRSKLTRDVVLHGKHPEDGAGGTGIYCLQNFADDFVHNESGTEVIVQFSL